jgi:hypothetical protein
VTGMLLDGVRPPDDGRKYARNILRINLLLINHLLHLVGLTFIYLLCLSAVKVNYTTNKDNEINKENV